MTPALPRSGGGNDGVGKRRERVGCWISRKGGGDVKGLSSDGDEKENWWGKDVVEMVLK